MTALPLRPFDAVTLRCRSAEGLEGRRL